MMVLFGRGRVGEAVPDKELLQRHAQGDPHAFAEIVTRHRDRMWAVALRTLGDPEEAADALQDAFLSAYRAAGRFRGDSAVTTWLHRIVVNACLDRIRRKAVRPTVNLPDTDTLDAVAPRTGDPTAAHEVTLDVTEALARLPFEQRAALVLVDMMGYSVEDAARVLDVPPGTVKSRCARGRARLAPHLRHLRNRRIGNRVEPSNVGTDVPAVPRQGGSPVLEEGGGAS
ncbi:RNA polymerase sigma factor SigM [Actinocorallia sp. API 0066]|uniref:RNA polymerase sigma factor SigM n=1 Tax=Actinocorallia sp. API 0066 TaxID=2896846 RepID=UPI001E6316D9|nr:RNA polymerase sigma factor SigM [Actinocorallia sp. API 0066]MCD0452427.1 RNA polymerase sigma factor SigM [Actinocorallia sp. API 0066]